MGLSHRCQQTHEPLSAHPFGIVLRVFRKVELTADECCKRAAAFVVSARRQQHASHVRVHEDRICGGGFVLRAERRAALQTFGCITSGRLVRNISGAEPLDADRQPLIVHHREHRGET